MNQQIKRLSQIAGKDSRVILGLMSGTSLDGLDMALCRISGHGLNTNAELLHFHTHPYADHFKSVISSIAFRADAPMEKVCLLNEWIAREHAAIILDTLKTWGVRSADVDLLASHGQTVFHSPALMRPTDDFGNGTLQIGDGDHLAYITGIMCISDFRQKHLAAGGEGAPLAAYGDYILFADKDDDVLLINIGGIANLTYIPAGHSFAEIICGDTGPGNRIMDSFIQSVSGKVHFDAGGQMANAGQVHEELLSALKAHPYFSLPLPKTTGPELFNLRYLYEVMDHTGIKHLPAEDIMATLNRLTASSICDALNTLPLTNRRKYMITGGGVHNITLMNYLKDNITGTAIQPPFSADAKEAVLFALLANETVAGDKSDYGSSGNNLPAISMGKISLPC